MAVVADADAVDVFAEVQVLVLVAQDGQPGLGQIGVPADERRDPAGVAYWWAIGTSGTTSADLLGELRAPESGGAHHDVGGDYARRRCGRR